MSANFANLILTGHAPWSGSSYGFVGGGGGWGVHEGESEGIKGFL